MLNTMPDGKIVQDYATTSMRNPLLDSNSDGVIYNIKDFFARPLICPGGNITWSNLSVPGTSLMTMDVPSQMLIANTLLADKLSGFYGFKATTVIKVQANAQRFQSGILLISVIPAKAYMDGHRVQICYSNLVTTSQLPSVRFNIAELDEVEIRVPFIAPELYRNSGDPYDWAQVRISVYAQSTGGNIPLTCWCHFEDCEFLYPVAQSGITAKGKKRARSYSVADAEDPGNLISRPLSTFSKGFSQLADSIPMLSSIASPTAWFLNAVAKGAAAFGFSKVIETVTRNSLVRRTFGHMNNCDVNDTSDSLALTVGNKISHLPGFAGTDIDEMSIAYIAGVPSYWTTFTYDITQVASTAIFTALVNPMANRTGAFITPSVGVAVPVDYFAPMGYIASQFNMWRGSIRFRIYAAKTDFHTGRLLFTFTPSVNGTINSLWVGNGYNYRWVWDIRDSHSFDITIPYVSSRPYTPCDNGNYGSIGKLTCWVLNQLAAPATVSSGISLIVEQFAGPDFEVAGPLATVGENYTPIYAYSGLVNVNHIHKHRARSYDLSPAIDPKVKAKKRAAEALIRGRRDVKYSIRAQGPEVNLTSDLSHLSGDLPDGNIPSGSGSNLNAMYCIGERVHSLRQVLKRTGIVAQLLSAPTTDTVFYFNPFVPTVSTTYNGGGQALLAPNFYCDNYSVYAMLFALQRGGMVVKTANNVGSAGSTTHTLVSYFNTRRGLFTDTSGTRFDNYADANSQVYTNNSSQATNDTLVPWYSFVCSEPIPHLDAPIDSFLDFRTFMNYKMVRVSVNANVSSTYTTNVYRQPADDFSFGGFLGVLPMMQATKSYR